MFYRTTLKSHIRVPPELLGNEVKTAITLQLKKQFEGYISREVGSVVEVSNVLEIGEGVIIPGDGAPYYETSFEIITFKPELQEVVWGMVKDIAEFGVFLNIGPMDGMVHVSQAMDDFVSLGKEKLLTGRDSKRTLKVGDLCKGRVIAVSFKDISNPKIGITMRQQGLGKPEWDQEVKKATDGGAAENAPEEKKAAVKKEKKEAAKK